VASTKSVLGSSSGSEPSAGSVGVKARRARKISSPLAATVRNEQKRARVRSFIDGAITRYIKRGCG
jgi:hypothetical protein